MLRDGFNIFVSQLIVNLSTFVIILIAPYFLSTGEFATLSLAFAAIYFGSTLIELGLNISGIKRYAEAKDEGYLAVMLAIKALFLALALLALPLSLLGGDVAFWCVVAVSATSLNLWFGLRAADQARQAFGRMARQGYLFAAVRVGCGLGALFTRDALLICLGVFAVPVLLAGLGNLGSVRTHWSRVSLPLVRQLVTYSFFVHLSSVAYVGCQYLPQLFIKARLGDIDIGTYGLVIAFLGPLVLVTQTVRTILLPKICAGEVSVDAIMANPRARLALAGLTVGFIACFLAGSLVLDRLYGSRLPQIGPAAAVFMSFYVVTTMLGQLNIDLHRQGLAWIEMLINVTRILVLAGSLYLFGNDLMTIVTITALVILALEVTLFLVVRRR